LFLRGVPNAIDRRLPERYEATLGLQFSAGGFSSDQRSHLADCRLTGLVVDRFALLFGAIQNSGYASARFFGDLYSPMVRAPADFCNQRIRISEDCGHSVLQTNAQSPLDPRLERHGWLRRPLAWDLDYQSVGFVH
jgi:hypothetical protein